MAPQRATTPAHPQSSTITITITRLLRHQHLRMGEQRQRQLGCLAAYPHQQQQRQGQVGRTPTPPQPLRLWALTLRSSMRRSSRQAGSQPWGSAPRACSRPCGRTNGGRWRGWWSGRQEGGSRYAAKGLYSGSAAGVAVHGLVAGWRGGWQYSLQCCGFVHQHASIFNKVQGPCVQHAEAQGGVCGRFFSIMFSCLGGRTTEGLADPLCRCRGVPAGCYAFSRRNPLGCSCTPQPPPQLACLPLPSRPSHRTGRGPAPIVGGCAPAASGTPRGDAGRQCRSRPNRAAAAGALFHQPLLRSCQPCGVPPAPAHQGGHPVR